MPLVSSPSWAAAQPAADVDAEIDMQGCIKDAICFSPGTVVGAWAGQRSKLHLLAMLPFGGIWGPRWLIGNDVLPPFEGPLRRTLLLHSLLPWLGCAGMLPINACVAPVLGAACGVAMGPCVVATMGAAAGFVVIPVGGTVLGAAAGWVVGLVAGLLMGAVGGFGLGSMLLLLLGCPVLGGWQTWIGPNSMVRAWDRAERIGRINGRRSPPASDNDDTRNTPSPVVPDKNPAH
jgi:hypothetical protein